MFNSARPTKEDSEKQKRALEDMHKAHLQQQAAAAKQGSSDQPTGIDAVIASWQKSLTETAGSVTASALVGSPGSPTPSPLFGPQEGKKKNEAKKGSHHKDKKKDDDTLLIRLSVPSDDTCEKPPAAEQPQQEEGKLVILDDYDNAKSKKKSHSRHNSTTPPAPADSAEAAGDLGSGLSSLLIPPLHGASSTPVSSSPTSPSPSSATATPPVASAPAGVGATSPSPSTPTPQQQQQPQQGGYGQPSQFIPQAYSGGPPQQQQQQQGGYGGSGPAPGSFHPPPYQNVAPYGLPPQQQQQQQSYGYGGGYGYPPQGYPMYPPQQQQHQQSAPMMGYPSPQAPLQPQMNAPMGYNQRPMGNPLGLSAPPYGQGAMMMGSPRPVSAPEVLADQLSNLDIAKQSYHMQPPPHAAGLMQPLVPVAAPMISSPDNPTGGGAAASDGDDEWHIDYSELETTKEIARGSFGVVYQGAFRGTEVAVKKLIQQHFSPEQMKDFLDEINMMKKLHHPNVVLLIGVCVKEPNLCIVTELLAGSMWNLLHDKNVRLEWKLQHKLLLDTAKGMNYLHLFKPPIIHRDLKSPNLLVDSHFNVKIADFGLARIKAQLMTGNLGTCQYMAPEVITSATYSEKADVYSYGVVIWEVLTRQAPWQGMQPMQIAYGVVHQSMRPQIPPGTAPPLAHLMQQCWHQDPLQRPSFTEILQQLKALPI